jgi:hypothetical protein
MKRISTMFGSSLSLKQMFGRALHHGHGGCAARDLERFVGVGAGQKPQAAVARNFGDRHRARVQLVAVLTDQHGVVEVAQEFEELVFGFVRGSVLVLRGGGHGGVEMHGTCLRNSRLEPRVARRARLSEVSAWQRAQVMLSSLA